MVVVIGIDVSVGKGKSYDNETQTVKSFTFQKIDPCNFNSLKSLINHLKTYKLTNSSHICISGCSGDREEAFVEEALDSFTPNLKFTFNNSFESEYLYLYGLIERQLHNHENMVVIRITDNDVSAEIFKMVENKKLILFRYYFVQGNPTVDTETAEKLISLVNSERYCKNFIIQYLSMKQKRIFQKCIKNSTVIFTKPVDASRSAMIYAMMLAKLAKIINVDVCSDNSIEALPDVTENGNIVIPKSIKTSACFSTNVFQEYIKRYEQVKAMSTSSRTMLFSPRYYIEKLTRERYNAYSKRKQLCRVRSESY